jgi:hypothetical protein
MQKDDLAGASTERYSSLRKHADGTGGPCFFLDVQVISFCFSSFAWFVYNSAYSIRAFRLPLMLRAIRVQGYLSYCSKARGFQA